MPVETSRKSDTSKYRSTAERRGTVGGAMEDETMVQSDGNTGRRLLSSEDANSLRGGEFPYNRVRHCLRANRPVDGFCESGPLSGNRGWFGGPERPLPPSPPSLASGDAGSRESHGGLFRIRFRAATAILRVAAET